MSDLNNKDFNRGFNNGGFNDDDLNDKFIDSEKLNIYDTPSIYASNMIFLFSVVVLFALEILLQFTGIELDIIGIPTFAMEVLFFLFPPLIYLAFKGASFKKVLRLNPISIKNVFIVIGIMLFSLPIIGVVNYIISLAVEAVGRSLPNPLPEVNNWVDLTLGLFIIALTPAVCEEVMARGLIMRGYERFGVKSMIVVSALLFSILHRNIQSLIPIFIMGLLLGYVTYRTNSIFAGIIAHFTNNAFAVIVTYGAAKLHEYTGVSINNTEQVMVSAPTLIELTFIIPIIALAGAVVITLLKELNKNTKETVKLALKYGSRLDTELQNDNTTKVMFSQYIPLILGLIIIGVEFGAQIAYIISG